jgi:hypothetical protein
MNLRSFLFVAVFALQQGGVASAGQAVAPTDYVYPAPHFRNIVNGAARIATVRIIKREALYGDALKLTQACAYRVTVKVTESFKGGNESFSFVSGTYDDFSDLTREYLVIAKLQPGVSAATRMAVGELLDQRSPASAKISCLMRQLSSAGLYVPTEYQTSWPFSEQANREFGGKWLVASMRKDSLFCGMSARDYLADHPESMLHVRQIRTGKEKHYIIAWPDVRALLKGGGGRFPCE